MLLHGVGSVAGAMAGATVMSVFGASSLFDYVASVYILLAAFAIYRITRKAAPMEKTPFAPVPTRAAPTVFEIGEDDDNKDGSEKSREDAAALEK